TETARALNLSAQEQDSLEDGSLTLTLPPQSAPLGGRSANQLVTLQLANPQSPQRAQQILEGLMTNVVEQNQRLQASRRPQQVVALSQRLEQVQKDLQTAERRLQDFLAQPGNDSLSADQNRLSQQINQSQANQQRLWSQIQALGRQRFSPGLASRQRSLQAQLRAEARREQSLRQRQGALPERELTRLRLTQGVDFQRLVYQNLLTALAQSQSLEVQDLLSIVLPAAPKPSPPASRTIPRSFLISLGGLGGSLLGALTALIVLTLLADRGLTPAALRQLLEREGVPLLAYLPALPRRASSRGLALLSDQPDPVYVAFYEHLRRRLGGHSPRIPRVVLVTSVGVKEGKTTTAYNLAIASAQANQRTLLVEADSRRPSQSGALGLWPPKGASLGLSETNLEESILLAPEVANLSILPSLGSSPHGERILLSPGMQRFLVAVRGHFDLVIIDAPPLNQGRAVFYLEPWSDGLILITRPGQTSAPLLTQTLARLKRRETPLLGAVINGVDDLFGLALNNLREEAPKEGPGYQG
ncbi:MAG: AAA family ATPase, partial [Cyanobacteriota bacterium]